MEFRKLRANEVECRVGTCKANGCSLLLYKDARCDMNILDETVGALNWQKSYQLIDNQLFCTISVWDESKQQWISKQDVGTESNTEAEKGRASDAQKRACFALGIGRELYTAPFIWVSSDQYSKLQGKDAPKDRFSVSKLEYKDNEISVVEIVNDSTGKIVYTYGAKPKAAKKVELKMEKQPKKDEKVEEAELKSRVLAYINRVKNPEMCEEYICKMFNIESSMQMDKAMCESFIEKMKAAGETV